MNHLKTSPVGVDVEIQAIQTRLFDKLTAKYNTTTPVFNIAMDGYGRVYKTERDGKMMPEHYLGSGEYRDVLLNDRKDLSFFFIEEPKVEYNVGGVLTSKIDIIFQAKLENIHKSVNHRADAELLANIYEILMSARRFTLEEVVKGRDALKGFEGHGLRDMQPYHFLKFTGEVSYAMNC